MDNWYLVGLYYDKYTPLFSLFGVKIFEGYYNIRTRKYKLVNKGKMKMNSVSDQDDTIEQMELNGYKPKYSFFIDIAEINIKIHDKLKGE